jgi:glycosyltransferase involved in cell wall biosynthesis
MMKNVLINGLNSKSGGGKSILNNYLTLLREESSVPFKYFVLTPNKEEYIHFNNNFITVVDIADLFKKNSLFLLLHYIGFPKLIKEFSIDIIFNLSDVPIPVKCKQIFLFDWAYAAYPDSPIWKDMDAMGWIVRRTKLYFFKKNLKFVTKLMAQTEAMKNRLAEVYNIDNIGVIPNAVSLDNLEGKESKDFLLPVGLKLVYLSCYYTHKNFEIFIPLARKIRDQSKNYKIIITIDKSQHPRAEKFLNTIKDEGLSDVIINVGPVPMEYVPSLYSQVDGLLMPTLLESFSGTYVEAMFHKIPIFTSKFDFAEGLCKDAGFYFDPFDEDSILSKLDNGFITRGLIDEKTSLGTEILAGMSDWEDTFSKIQTVVLTTLEE